MKSLPECEDYRTDPKIVLEENKSKITFLNAARKEILIIKIDGCVINDSKTLRCDYAIVPCDEVEIYVELKGSNVSHAVEQIKSTISSLSSNPQKIRKLCFIVSTQVPRQTTSTQQLKSQFKRKFNAIFQMKSIQDNYDLSSL